MSAQYQVVGATAAEIATSIEAGVRTGELPTGAALPAVRALAGQLAVSPATVAKAYQALRQRGLIETAGRHGTRVRARPPVATRRGALRLAPPPGALDLSNGEPDPRLLPPLGPHLAALAARVDPPTGYAAGGILPELAAAARARFAADGVPADAISVASATLDGIERILSAHLRPGDPVAVEDPGWVNLLDLIAALDLRPVGVPVDEAGPTVAGLRAALAGGVRALIVTTRAHNPTGAAVTADRARALRAVLATHPDLLLIEDDHAAELASVPLRSLSGAVRNWVFVRSMSKPYGPDLRLALLAGDEATIARFTGRTRVGPGWVSTLLQRLTLLLWEDPDVSERIAVARASYERRRDALRAALIERGLPAYGRTGINVWVHVPDETRAVAALRDAGYVVAPGSLYRMATASAIRITIGRLALEQVEPLADAVARAVGGGESSAFSA